MADNATSEPLSSGFPMTNTKALPRQPTQEMVDAFGVFWRASALSEYLCTAIYQAAHDAAPAGVGVDREELIDLVIDSFNASSTKRDANTVPREDLDDQTIEVFGELADAILSRLQQGEGR